MESLLIVAQNNAIGTNYVKVKTDHMQKRTKLGLCGDRDETDIHIISEHSKLLQKEYKSRHDWVGKVIHLELFKKLTFRHADKWYWHKLDSLLVNELLRCKWIT